VIQTPAPEPTVIIQVPEPPVPPDPVIIQDFPGGFGELIPIAGMLTGIIITAMFVLGPIGKAIGAVIRHWLGGGNRQEGLSAEEMDELHARLDGLTRQVAELAERQDFTDRMLAQVRKERALPPTDVAG
jgi:hypothetical protein